MGNLSSYEIFEMKAAELFFVIHDDEGYFRELRAHIRHIRWLSAIHVQIKQGGKPCLPY